MSAKQLAVYSTVTNQHLARMFDVTRFRLGGFGGWNHEMPRQNIESATIRGQMGIQPGTGSFFRGVQVADIAASKESIRKSLFSFEEDDKEYESFIAHDWRNKRIGEFSCDPEKLANYFVPTEGPFQTTPAFFKPEVLSKYKAGNLRGYSLHLLQMRGVFRNMISREYGPGGSIPAKPIVRNLSLSKEEIAEIEWRWESLKPYLKPGTFEG